MVNPAYPLKIARGTTQTAESSAGAVPNASPTSDILTVTGDAYVGSSDEALSIQDACGTCERAPWGVRLVSLLP